MIGALLQNLTSGPAFRAKIVGFGGVNITQNDHTKRLQG